MNKKGITAIVALVIIVVGLAVGIYFLKNGKGDMQAPQMPPMPVVVDKPEVADVESFYYTTGYAEATESVEVRARVEGYLEKIHFEDSSNVEKGDLLFEIEPDVYQANLGQAKAGLQSTEAQLLSAEADYQRVLDANKTNPNTVSEEIVSQRKAARDRALAANESAKADLKTAEINLSYTKLYAPISGRVSRNYVDEGNLIGAGDHTLLTSIVKLDPIYVYFDVSETMMADYFIKHSATHYKDVKSKFYVAVSSQKDYPFTGILDYVDNKVDRSTGTFNVRGTIENSGLIIYPGMFVRIKIPVGTIKDAIIIEEKAIGTDLSGKYVYVVGEGNVVEKRSVELGQLDGTKRVVIAGLTADDTYIYEGIQKARPGLPVSPMPRGMQMQAPNGDANQQGETTQQEVGK